MGKTFRLGVKIFISIFLFSLLVPFQTVKAKERIKLSSLSQDFGPTSVLDLTGNKSYSLNNEEVVALYNRSSQEIGEVKTYTTQESWDSKGEDYLLAVFSLNSLPKNIAIQEVKLTHIFWKDAANTKNLIQSTYSLDKAYNDTWHTDWQMPAPVDISASPTGEEIVQKIDLTSVITSLIDLQPLAVKFQVQSEETLEEEVAKTTHDLLTLSVSYNRLPSIELIQPEDKTGFGVYTEEEEGYPASRPVFKWQVSDPDGDQLVSRWQLVEKKDFVCDFSTPLLDKELIVETEYQPQSDLAEGLYCWRVGVSDDGGLNYQWSDSYEFSIDITSPPALSEVRIDPSPSKKFNNINKPHIWGKFEAKDSDSVVAVVSFLNTGLDEGYFYFIPRKNDGFDSLDPNTLLFYGKGLTATSLSQVSLQQAKEDNWQEAKYLKDGIYKVVAFALDGVANSSELKDWIVFDELYRLDTKAPSAPLVSLELREGKIVVSWQAVEDGIYYEVYRDNKLVAYTNSLMFVEENLPQGTKYTYWVVAVDQAGNRSRPSNSVDIYIPEPRVSSTSYQQPAVSYTPSVLVPEVQAKTQVPPKTEEDQSIEPEGQVRGEEEAKGFNWALLVAIILGIVLVVGGGMYWWYTREEDEI
ncbi:fibronectin type III domain-containing protein [bacterium]|nr:fibronectin type III domain-containing protein [bacterium]